MKIAIIGSGAIGGFIGSRLIERGHDITFVVGPSRRENLHRYGLVVTSAFGRFRQRVKAIEPDHIGHPFELVLLCPRAHALASALAASRSAINPGTVVLPLIEGVRQFETALHQTEARHVVGAVFEARLWMDADGQIHHRLPAAEITLGAFMEEDQSAVADMMSCLSGRGLMVLASDRIRSKAWERFGFQVASIATTQYIGGPLRDALRSPFGTNYFRDALVDCIRLGEAAGYDPNALTARRYERAVFYEGAPIQAPPVPSFSGRASAEANFLLEEMAQIAKTASVDLPWLNSVLTRSLEAGAQAEPWTERLRLIR